MHFPIPLCSKSKQKIAYVCINYNCPINPFICNLCQFNQCKQQHSQNCKRITWNQFQFNIFKVQQLTKELIQTNINHLIKRFERLNKKMMARWEEDIDTIKKVGYKFCNYNFEKKMKNKQLGKQFKLQYIRMMEGKEMMQNQIISYIIKKLGQLLENETDSFSQSSIIKFYDQIIKLFPHSDQSYLLRAQKYYSLDRFQKSLTDLDQCLNINQSNVDAIILRGFIYQQLQQYNCAESSYSMAIIMDPNNPQIYFHLAELYYKQEMFKQAEINYTLAIQLKPNSLIYYQQRLQVYLKLNKYYKAFDDCNHILRIDPSQISNYNMKFSICKKLGKMNEAIVCLDQLIHRGYGNSKIYGQRGQMMIDMNRIQEGIMNLELSYEMDPFETKGCIYKAFRLQQEDRIEQAEELYNFCMNEGNRLESLKLIYKLWIKTRKEQKKQQLKIFKKSRDSQDDERWNTI